MHPVRTSAKAVIIQEGALLLLKNLDSEGDWYCLPGGGQDRGETLTDALRRECLEEIGAEVSVGPLLFVREYIEANHEFAELDSDFHQIDFMFECSIVGEYEPASGITPDTDQTGVVWLDLAALDEYRIYPQIIRTIVRDAASNGVYLGDVN